jgi:hypothetical protein
VNSSSAVLAPTGTVAPEDEEDKEESNVQGGTVAYLTLKPQDGTAAYIPFPCADRAPLAVGSHNNAVFMSSSQPMSTEREIRPKQQNLKRHRNNNNNKSSSPSSSSQDHSQLHPQATSALTLTTTSRCLDDTKRRMLAHRFPCNSPRPNAIPVYEDDLHLQQQYPHDDDHHPILGKEMTDARFSCQEMMMNTSFLMGDEDSENVAPQNLFASSMMTKSDSTQQQQQQQKQSSDSVVRHDVSMEVSQ